MERAILDSPRREQCSKLEEKNIKETNAKLTKFIEDFDTVQLPSKRAKNRQNSVQLSLAQEKILKRQSLIDSRVQRLEANTFKKMQLDSRRPSTMSGASVQS